MNKKSFKGLHAQVIYAILMVLCCLFTIFIFRTTVKIKNNYDNLVFLMNDYSECNVAITDMKKSSGRLTYFAICFLQRHDPEYLERYFYELEEMDRRERAVDIVSVTHQDDITDINTKMAFRESEMLVNIELYAMRLMCDAINYKESLLPDRLKNVELIKEHIEMSCDDKISFANHIIFSDKHLRSRDLMTEYSDIALSSLLNLYTSEETKSNTYINSQFSLQTLFIKVLFIMCIVLYILLVVLIFIPLHKHFLAIKSGKKMDMEGAFEVRYIARAYNALRDKNALDASILKHKAEHDPLTGLINRSAFDEIISLLSTSHEPVAYLIIDIDFFKHVNDEYGHPIGDKVLIKIAHLLNEQFRATDYVARIGGDEFAVIMTKFGTAPMDIIRAKVDGLNKMLQMAEDNIPSVSLSVGVAFSDNGFTTNLIEDADKALYKVKRSGRCNCFFYEKDKCKN